MLTLSDILDPDELAADVGDGLVKATRHPAGGLQILNYTPKAQYEGVWTPATRLCRGLIITGERPPFTGDEAVVARPFSKFFNASEHATLPLDEPFEVYDKVDGSLGILYPGPDGQPAIATRGSFASDQAQHATDVLRRRYPQVSVPDGQTWLFEIVYPGNRIVVDYGDQDDLVFLAALDNATGDDVAWPDEQQWPGPRTAAVPAGSFEELTRIAERGDADREGYVVKFASGLRVKVKHAEYVRLHRIVTGLTAKRVWELLAAGDDLAELRDAAPDELHDWIDDTEAGLRAAQQAIVDDAYAWLADPTVGAAKARPDDRQARKGAAQQITRQASHPGLVFALLDGRDDDVHAKAWKLVEPAGD